MFVRKFWYHADVHFFHNYSVIIMYHNLIWAENLRELGAKCAKGLLILYLLKLNPQYFRNAINCHRDMMTGSETAS